MLLPNRRSIKTTFQDEYVEKEAFLWLLLEKYNVSEFRELFREVDWGLLPSGSSPNLPWSFDPSGSHLRALLTIHFREVFQTLCSRLNHQRWVWRDSCLKTPKESHSLIQWKFIGTCYVPGTMLGTWENRQIGSFTLGGCFLMEEANNKVTNK